MSKKQQSKPIDKKTEVCLRLVEWRKKSGITQVAAAKVIGVKAGTYINWEQRKRRPHGLSLIALEGFLAKTEGRAR